MALFNLKNKKPAKTTKKAKPEPKAEKPAVALKPKKVSAIAFRVLQEPQVTEKATDLTAIGQYVFKVFPNATKGDIKRVVQDVYGVTVVAVKIIKVPAKRRRIGRNEGWREGYKKAIVKLAKGQEIEIMPR
jgi:large subunit ribosomal protein L23